MFVVQWLKLVIVAQGHWTRITVVDADRAMNQRV